MKASYGITKPFGLKIKVYSGKNGLIKVLFLYMTSGLQQEVGWTLMNFVVIMTYTLIF